jgi:hypothetical protein
MKINDTAADADAAGKQGSTAAAPLPRAHLSASSNRLAATAAGAALAGSTVRLAFFLARKPTASFDRHHAKFRA